MSNLNELSRETITHWLETVNDYGVGKGEYWVPTREAFERLCHMALRALQDQKHEEHTPTSQDNPSSGGVEGDSGCICHGNWRLIISECRDLFDRQYREGRTGHVYTFYGLVHGSDDYYYGMYSKEHGAQLLSCVGSIAGHGFELIPSPKN